MKTLRPFCLMLAIVMTAMLVYAAGVGRRSGPLVLAGRAMGMEYRITLRLTPTSQESAEIASEICRTLAEVERLISTWRSDSELSRFNQAPAGEWIPVSPDIVRLAGHASQLSEMTDGLYDVTAGPLVNLWGFGKETLSVMPDKEQIAEARKSVGFAHLHTRKNPPALKKDVAGVRVDLSSLGEGYAIEQLAKALSERGIADFLVQVGGAEMGRGLSQRNRPWHIGIESPLEHERDFRRIVSLDDAAISTSGSYRKYYDRDGKRFSHIINPHTGRPIEHDMVAVTVVHASAIWADGYATAIMAMGPDAGFALAQKHRLAALLTIRTAAGVFEERETPEFARLQRIGAE